MLTLLRKAGEFGYLAAIKNGLWVPRSFDAKWYASSYGTSNIGKKSAWRHYSKVGWKLGYDPSQLFSTTWYISNNADVAQANLNPLVHYELYGRKEGRLPSPDAIGQKYSLEYEVDLIDTDHITEYHSSWSVCFDTEWYSKTYRKDETTSFDWKHYDLVGRHKGFDPCEFFWTDWYLENNPDVLSAGLNPLVHYEQYGEAEGRFPSPLFDPEWYASNYGLPRKGIQLLGHFLRKGRIKGYLPSRKSALVSINGSKGTPGLGAQLLQRIEWKIQNAGNRAIMSAPLSDGCLLFKEKGWIRPTNPMLDTIGQQMARRDSRKGRPYWGEAVDAIIIGGSSAIYASEQVIHDELYSLTKSKPNDVRVKRPEKSWLNNGNFYEEYTIDITPVLKSGIHLFKEYEQNYFHFITEIAPKIIFIESNDIDFDLDLLVSDDLPDNIYEIIDVLKHPKRRVVKLRRDLPYKVEKLIHVSDLSWIDDVYYSVPKIQDTYIPESLIQMMRTQLLGRQEASARSGRKLYLARPGARRAVKNEMEIINRLIPLGFEVPKLSALSFRSQVELFSRADIVVGGTGAAFTNLLWCREGARAILLYPDHPYNNMTFWDEISRFSNVKVDYITGKREHKVTGLHSMHDDFRIDLDKLLDIIKCD